MPPVPDVSMQTYEAVDWPCLKCLETRIVVLRGLRSQSALACFKQMASSLSFCFLRGDLWKITDITGGHTEDSDLFPFGLVGVLS
jgi:hypothetical protein